MKIIMPIQPLKPMNMGAAKGTDNNIEKTGKTFGDMLNNAINQVNDLELNSEDMKEKLVTGEVQDIHSVMIAGEKANIALQLTMQVRNKAIEAYQEITRMQV